MKLFNLLFLLFFIFINSQAQVSITADDYSAQVDIGDSVFTYRDATTTSVDIGSPGETSWDFTSLVAANEFVTVSKDFASSPYASNFPGSEYASNYEGVFEGVQSNTWVYNTIGTSLLTHGTGTVANAQTGDIKTIIKFTPAWSQYEFPIEYNNTWNYSGTQEINTTVQVPVIGDYTTTLTQTRNVTSTVDAWGVVTMPDGKRLNALRIKEVTTLQTDGQPDAVTLIYHILTKTNEHVSITVSDLNATSGNVSIDAISWTTGDGIDLSPTVTVTAPSALVAIAGSSSINLTWIDASDNEDGFRIERAISGSESFSQLAEVAANANSYSDETAEAGTEYSYRVAAYSGSTVSAFSNTVTAMISVSITVTAPSSLSAEASENGINLSWTDTSDNEEGFSIERSEGGGEFSEIATVDANATSYSDVTAQADVAYSYRVAAFNGDVMSEFSNEVSATIVSTALESSEGLPVEFSLSQNYPNPFNPTTKISFSITQSGLTTLQVYDVLGKEVAELVNENLSAGNYSVDFNASNLSSGIYFYKLVSGNNVLVNKMILTK